MTYDVERRGLNCEADERKRTRQGRNPKRRDRGYFAAKESI